MTSQDSELHVLVPAAAGGDKAACQRIMEIIHPAVLRYARARLSAGKHPTAEDVAQDVCLAVAQAIGNYRDQGRPFMAFVYGIASNKVADAHRFQGRDKASPTDEVPETTLEHDTPETFALVADGSNRVRMLLDSLSDKARDIIILRVFEGRSAEETAAIVGSTPGAVRVAQHRALASLRKMLNDQEQS